MRLEFSTCSKLTRWTSVPCDILSMTVLMVSATPSIVPTRIGIRTDTGAGCLWGGVIWISNRWQGTEINLWSGYHSRSSRTMLGKLMCAEITHSSMVFPHKMYSGNLCTTFSVTNLQIIATATEVKVFQKPFSSATSAPGISASQTYLLTMNNIAPTRIARDLAPGRPGIEFWWRWTLSSVDQRMRWAFSTLTASARHSCSNLLLIVLRHVLNTELVFAGSRTSSPSSTFSWTSLWHLSVFFSSSMISFSCLDVSWADGLIFRRSWNSLQCELHHRQATIGTNIYECNTINSIHSIRTYINTSIILWLTILFSLLSSTLFRTFQSLCIMISCCAHLAWTRLAGITFAGSIKCLLILFPVYLLISTKNMFGWCPSFNLKPFEMQQLYQI